MDSNEGVIKDDLLIIDGKIKAFGQEAKKEALKRKLKVSKSSNKLIAPMLSLIHI